MLEFERLFFVQNKSGIKFVTAVLCYKILKNRNYPPTHMNCEPLISYYKSESLLQPCKNITFIGQLIIVKYLKQQLYQTKQKKIF